MFVDEISEEKAAFTYKPDSTVVARGNYDNPHAWTVAKYRCKQLTDECWVEINENSPANEVVYKVLMQYLPSE